MTIGPDEDLVATTYVPAVGHEDSRPYIDWAAVFAGAVIAWAIAFILGSFGAGLGLTIVGSPWEEGMSPQWFLIAAGIYFIWVQVTSVITGAYLTGRMRRRVGDAGVHEIEVRDGAHGLLVWGVSALIGAAMALAAATAGVGAASKVLGGTVAIGAEGMSGESEGRINYIVSRLFRPEAGGTSSDVAGSARGEDDAANRGSGRDGVLQTLKNVGLDGELSEDDKRYIAQIVAAETGLSQQAAQARVNEYLSTALTEIRQAAETARKSGIIGAFLTAATLLVSAIAGWWAASLGGSHRDEGTDFSRWFTTR